MNVKFVFSPIIEYRWNYSDWTECSRTCGIGVRTRDVNCINVTIPIDLRFKALINDSTVVGVINDSFCVRYPGAEIMPISRELCSVQDCPIWLVGRYGPVSLFTTF